MSKGGTGEALPEPGDLIEMYAESLDIVGADPLPGTLQELDVPL
jgi:hypothetical protein